MMRVEAKRTASLFFGACAVAVLVGARPLVTMAAAETPAEQSVILAQTHSMSPMMWDVDLPGLDFASFELRAPDPGECERLCAQHAQCRAWTYVKPYTIQGSVPRCWLKNGVPRSQRNTCCVSGTKQQPGR